MGSARRDEDARASGTENVALTGVFADLRAVGRLLTLRARELGPDDAEEIGYLAGLVQSHAEQGLQRIAHPAGGKSTAKSATARRR